MAGEMKMLCRVLIFRAVTAADMTTGQAFPQMNPLIA
jgi:hypothetical protein